MSYYFCAGVVVLCSLSVDGSLYKARLRWESMFVFMFFSSNDGLSSFFATPTGRCTHLAVFAVVAQHTLDDKSKLV